MEEAEQPQCRALSLRVVDENMKTSSDLEGFFEEQETTIVERRFC